MLLLSNPLQNLYHLLYKDLQDLTYTLKLTGNSFLIVIFIKYRFLQTGLTTWYNDVTKTPMEA